MILTEQVKIAQQNSEAKNNLSSKRATIWRHKEKQNMQMPVKVSFFIDVLLYHKWGM